MADFAHNSSGAVDRGKQFEEIHLHNVDYNRFDKSFDNRITFNTGPIYPVVKQKGYPGDVFHCNISALVRAAPLAAPVYQKYDIYFHGFFVPDRLLWSHFKEFRSPGDGEVSMAEMLTYQPPALPSIAIGDFFSAAGLEDMQTVAELNASPYAKLWDCFNLPSPLEYSGIGVGDDGVEILGVPSVEINYDATEDTTEIESLPFRAYYLIWYEYYRDQNNYKSSKLNIGLDGKETTDGNLSLFHLMPRSWEKDYFTSCLPSAQRGAPVSISLGDAAPVYANGASAAVSLRNPIFSMQVNNTQNVVENKLTNWKWGTESDYHAVFKGAQSGAADTNLSTAVGIDGTMQFGSSVGNPSLIGYADISAASAVTIESLRVASRTQEWLEKQARAGSRYNEYLLSHWGVVPSDARLQRPQYIGGGKAAISISEVMNTTSTDAGSYVGKAIGSDNNLGFGDFYCEEDGYIFVMMSILPRTSYSQGIPREWRMFDPLDWVNPEFANLGEQEVKVDEIFHDFSNPSNSEEVFGFQARYQEAKYSFDEIHGEFRTSLNYWTESRLFNSSPKLGYDFISCNASDRVFNITANDIADHWYADIWVNLLVDRKLPEFSIPQL